MEPKGMKAKKDTILTAISIGILFFVAMNDWNWRSFLVLLAVILLVFAWYRRK
jgi:hypothetical protein